MNMSRLTTIYYFMPYQLQIGKHNVYKLPTYILANLKYSLRKCLEAILLLFPLCLKL